MKRYVLLLCAIWLSICLYAQKTDRKQLIGKWEIISMSDGHMSIGQHYTAEQISALLQTVRGAGGNKEITKADSLEVVDKMDSLGRMLHQSFLDFRNDGTCLIYLKFLEEEDDKDNSSTQTYRWIDDHKIEMVENNDNKSTLTIKSLTSTEADITLSEKSDFKLHMTLKKL